MITSTSATTAELLELLLRDRPALSRRQVEADRVIATWREALPVDRTARAID